MKDGLMKINAYNQLISEIETFRTKQFSFDNGQHADLLFKVWSQLKGVDDKLETKITKRWSEIGFQGKPPNIIYQNM